MERASGVLLFGFQRFARQFADFSPTGLDFLDLMQLLGGQLIDVLGRGVGFFRLRACQRSGDQCFLGVGIADRSAFCGRGDREFGALCLIQRGLRARGLCLGGELLGLFLLLAFLPELAEFVALACQVGGALVLLARPDLALGVTIEIDQRNMARADVAAAAAFDAVEQVVFLRTAEVARLGETKQFLRLQLGRAGVGAAGAARWRAGVRPRARGTPPRCCARPDR